MAGYVRQAGTCIARREKVFQKELLSVLRLHWGVVPQWLGSSPTEKVRDAIPGDPEQPGTHLLDGPHQPISLHEFIEDFLQDVLCVTLVDNLLPDEIAKPGLFPRNCRRDAVVLLFGHRLDAERVHHPLV
jgi:hypothetical protein